MLKQQGDLDLVFQALADPTRRSMLDRMTLGPASVSDLARPYTMTLAAVLQHLRVLEDCGLVRTEKQGRVRLCTLEPETLRSAEHWIVERRTTWERRLDRLDTVLADLEPADVADDRVLPAEGQEKSPTPSEGEQP